MKPNVVWKKASEWALSHSTAPSALAVPKALFVIVAMVLSIGLADFASGIRISLAVFYLIPILLAVAWFGWELAAGVAVACVALRLLGDSVSSGSPLLPVWVWWNSASSLLVFLFVVWIFSNLLSLYGQLEQRVQDRTTELLEAVEQRRRLEHELLMVSSNERNSMGQELHDDICQHLVGTTLAAKVLSQRLSQQDSAWAAEAQAIVALIEQGTAKTRQLARGLLLSSIDPRQLAERLDELAEEGSRSGISCSFRCAGDVIVANADTAAQLYRIAQEAMRNAIAHSGATTVGITLTSEAQAICLTVEDDGRGLPPARSGSGMGLPIMAHRAGYIGATLSWSSATPHGTRLVCRMTTPIPLT